MRFRRPLRFILLLVLLLAGVAAWWLLATEAGLAWAWGRTTAALDGRLAAGRVSGRLLGPLRLDDLRLEKNGTRLAVDSLVLDWRPGWLLGGRLALRDVVAEGVRLELAAAQGVDAAPPTALILPLALGVEDGVLRDLVLLRPGATPLSVEEITLAALWRDSRLRLAPLRARGPWGSLNLDGQLATGPGVASDLAAQWALTFDAAQVGFESVAALPVSGAGRVTGTYAEPRFAVRLSAPFALDATGSLAWQAAPLRWQATLDLPPLALATVQAQWPALELGGRARLVGSGTDFILEAEGEAAEARSGRWGYSGRLAYEAAGWRLERLALTPRGGGGEVVLAGRWAGDADEAVIEARWSGFSHPLLPGWRSDGSLEAGGLPGNYRGRATLEAAREGLPPVQASADFAGNADGVEFPALAGQWLAGAWQGGGAVGWRDGLHWRARLDGAHVNPGLLDGRWDGELAVGAAAEGSLREGRLGLELTQLQLRGILAGRPLRLDGAARLDDRQLVVRRLELRSGTARLSARGELGEAWAVGWQLEAGNLVDLWPGAAGSLGLKGRIDGPLRQPRLRLEGGGKALAYGGTTLAQGQLRADVDLAGVLPWAVDLQLRGAERGEQRLETARLRLDGGAARHELRLDAGLAGGGTLAVRAQGTWTTPRWQGELSDGRLELPALGRWRAAPARLEWGPDEGLLQPWCWRGEGDVEGAHACLGADAVAGSWNASAALAGVPLALLEPWLPRSDIALSGSAGGAVAAAGERAHMTALTARLAVADGRLLYRLPDGAVDSALRTLRLDMDGDDAGLAARLEAEADDGGRMTARVALPGWMPGLVLADTQPVEGRLDLEADRLDWLTYLEPNLLRPEGRLQVHLNLAGSVGSPALTGDLALREGVVLLPAAGTRLDDITLEGRSADGRTLTLSGSARSGPGRLAVSGQLASERLGRWRAEVALKGEQFELVRLVQARALVSPDLKVVLEWGREAGQPRAATGGIRATVSGELAVPQADVNLPRLPTMVEVSPDEVIVDAAEEEAALRRWRLVLDLRLVAGERVRLEGYGFSGRLAGAVALRGETPGLTRAQGELNIHDGRYEAYGQKLVVERGRLLFVDSPPDNPGLDIRAVRPLPDPDQVVGVEVGGRLKDPRLRLFSVPVLEESEALSWLVLGRPLTATSRTEADALYRAAFALGGERAARGIALQFGLDEVSLEQGSTSGEAAVVLGKYLSPRLYLQYAVGLWETANRLRLRYQLSPHWSLKMEQGEQSGADLFYVIER
jgi:translocation and assembly module TamB